MKPREYCCCAIPLFNVGIYAALTEQFVAALTAGILAVATPSIVSAAGATPGFAKWLFAIPCFVAAGLQVLGYLAVGGEKSILFRRYQTLHGLTLSVIFSVALTWVILSIAKHSTARTQCEKNFYPDTSNSALATESRLLCNIFPWVTAGVAGGLWVVMAIMQGYMYLVVSGYGSAQRDDHKKFKDDPSATDNILLADRMAWDARDDSTNDLAGAAKGQAEYSHLRNVSNASTMMEDKPMAAYDTIRGYHNQTPQASQDYDAGYGYSGSPQRKLTRSNRGPETFDQSFFRTPQ